MKHFIYIAIFLACFVNTKAQTNLVPNPSFEIHDTCPTTQDQITYATGWSAYRSVVEYFNTCASYSTTVSIPSNAGGYQNASCGNAYIGVYSYFPGSIYEKGIAGCQLNSQLTIGAKYYVSFKASLSDIDSTQWYNTATNNLGILFSTVPYHFNSPSPINNFAHVYAHNIITDTLGWTQIFGSFIADSTYKYLSIGNFFDNAHTNKTYFFSDPDSAAFYFIDEVCVSTDSAYTATWNCTMVGIEKYNPSNAINIYPNPSINGFFYTNITLSKEQIEVFDVLGKSLKKFYASGNVIDLNFLENGIYIIEINDIEYKSKQKLIINK